MFLSLPPCPRVNSLANLPRSTFLMNKGGWQVKGQGGRDRNKKRQKQEETETERQTGKPGADDADDAA